MEDEIFQRKLNSVIRQFRSELTKEYALSILRFLNDRAPHMVRLKDVKDATVGDTIKYESQFFRIIKQLADERVIYGFVDKHSREPGKKPVYLRLSKQYPNYFFDNHEDLLKNYADCSIWRDASLIILKKYPDVKMEIEAEYQTIKKTKQDLIKELKKSDAELLKEAKERMKDADLGPGEMLSPWEDLDKDD